MTASSKSLIKLVLGAGLVFLLMLGPILWYGKPGLLTSFLLGYAISLMNMAASYFALRWGFKQKLKTFYAVLFGGMALRFILFAGMVILILQLTKLPLSGFLLSFIVFYVFLQYFEIKFISNELKAHKFSS
jgi:hypothetical protein